MVTDNEGGVGGNDDCKDYENDEDGEDEDDDISDAIIHDS